MHGADHAFILARRRKASEIQDGGCAQSWETASAGRASSRVKFHARPPARLPVRPPPELLLRPDSAGLPGAAPPPSRRLQALKTTPTAVPLTATATVLQAARAGTHHPGPQHEAVTFQRHLPPTRPARPSQNTTK